MKIIKTYDAIAYVADDGTPFDTQEEALRHDKEKLNKEKKNSDIIKRNENIMDRKAKAIMHRELMDLLLKNIQNDNDFFNRLLYALQIISNELNRFEVKAETP